VEAHLKLYLRTYRIGGETIKGGEIPSRGSGEGGVVRNMSNPNLARPAFGLLSLSSFL
jgi:hypothetical protein